MRTDTELESRLRELFTTLADQTVVGAAAPKQPIAARQRRPWPYFVAAAVTTLLVAGVIVVQLVDDRSPSNTPPAGEPTGLFPAGDAERVLDIGYQSPTEVTLAYLAERLAVDDGELSATFVSMRPPTMVGHDEALVQFRLSRGEDQPPDATGEVLARRIHDGSGATGWTVVEAMIRLGDLTALSYIDGTVTGTFASTHDQPRVVSVHDPLTGETLASQRLTGPRESTTDRWGDTKLLDEFRIEGLDPPAVAVRAINPADTEGLPPEFAEILIAEGETQRGGHEERFHELARANVTEDPLWTGQPSVLDRLSQDAPVTVIDNDELTIELQVSAPGEFCFDVSFSDNSDLGVADWDCAAKRTVESPYGHMPLWTSTAPDRTILVGIVPDSVISITDASGRTITLADNVWYDVIDGTPHAYVFTFADGSNYVMWEGDTTFRLGGARP